MDMLIAKQRYEDITKELMLIGKKFIIREQGKGYTLYRPPVGVSEMRRIIAVDKCLTREEAGLAVKSLIEKGGITIC